MSRKVLQGTLPAWAAFCLAISVMALAWYFAHSAAQRDALQRLETGARAVQADLDERLRAHEQVFRDGLSAFHSWRTVTRENRRHSVEHQEISLNYPGLRGAGCAEVVSPDDRDCEQSVRAAAVSDYSIWPEGEREIRPAIVYPEPFDWRNRRAFGHDMFQNPVRRAAMERARVAGLSSFAGEVPPVQALLIAAGVGLLVGSLLWGIAWRLGRSRGRSTSMNEPLQRDIAHREQMESQLRETETSFRYLFEKNPNPMWVYDRRTLEILEVNAAAVRHYGYSYEEFRRLRISDLRPEEDLSRLTSHLEDLTEGLMASGEWRHITKEGRVIDVEIVSHSLEFRQRSAALVVAWDITERKRAAEALRESEAAARGVLDAALDAFVRMDESGRVTEWNPMAERTFGWTRDEAKGRLLEEILIPEDQRQAHRQGLARFLATGEAPLLNRRIEVQGLHRSGREMPVELTILALETDRGYSFSAFLRDLTQQKEAEEQLRHAQKLEAVGQLTGGIAHDFNNLLTVIIGNLELARVQERGSPPPGETIGDALAAAERGAALTHRLLAFSRKQTLQPGRTNLNAMIRGMIDLLKRTLGEDIEIEARLAENLWAELADASQVENALLNLALNARDAMPDGGKLTIETGNVTLDEEYTARSADVEPGDYVMLAVTDTGTGMPPEVVERACDPFFTTKEVGKGSGLGLSMIFGFAKQSDGHLKVYSEAGHGTTVKLYLPRATSVTPDTASPEARDDEVRGSETILVVEDEEAVRRLVVANLRSMGYRVLEAADARSAAEVIRGEEPIDLLFTDVVLPGGRTGRQLAEDARELRPEMRVLYTSGYTQNSIVHQGRLDSGVHILSKPYRREDLSRKVREVLRTDHDA